MIFSVGHGRKPEKTRLRSNATANSFQLRRRTARLRRCGTHIPPLLLSKGVVILSPSPVIPSEAKNLALVRAWRGGETPALPQGQVKVASAVRPRRGRRSLAVGETHGR
jgi:hypothetical protein